jgi:LacI family transcriptional regulator
MAVTVKDVASAAGVSTATVSRVLNDNPGVAAATRTRVLRAIQDTGYRMNTIARSLKTSRTRTIGFLVPEIVNEFFMNIARGVEDALRAAGYSLIICSANEAVSGEKKQLELLAEKCVDGIIIIPSTGQGEHYRRLTELDIPAVLVDRRVDGFVADTVLVENREGSYAAVEYLIKRGTTRFGFIGGDPALTTARERYQGFLAALHDHSLEADEEIIKFGDFHVESGYTLMGELMESPRPPEHIFIANYFMHIGATKYVIEHLGDLPQAVQFASFDDMELSALLGFSSVTVAQPMAEMGATAARLLLSRINGGGPGGAQTLRLKTKLLTRS